MKKKITPELVSLKIGAFFAFFLAQSEIFVGHDLQISRFVLKLQNRNRALQGKCFQAWIVSFATHFAK